MISDGKLPYPQAFSITPTSLFSIRETIVRLYGGHGNLVATELAVLLFVALRALYGLLTDKKTT